MRQLPALLLLVVAALPLGAKWKAKEKRYDPVAINDVRQIAGRYVGINPDYAVELQVSDGVITGTFRNFGSKLTLEAIRLEGAELTARVNGLPLHATFVNRVKNGERVFGLIVHDADVQIENVTLSQIFCRREVSG